MGRGRVLSAQFQRAHELGRPVGDCFLGASVHLGVHESCSNLRQAVMPEQPYSSPPIIDAIIEIRFAEAIDEAVREKVGRKFAEKYPIAEEMIHQEIAMEVQQESIATRATIFERVNKRAKVETSEILQIGTRFLSVANGAPYGGWELLFKRFEDDWMAASKTWGHRKIDRVGVRYINRLDLLADDDGIVEYEKYLNLRINLPNEFPPINAYNLAFETILPAIHGGARVHSAVVPPALPGRTSFTLDIDVWKNSEVPQKLADVLGLLARMRVEKNKLFETFITDAARSHFNAAS